MSARAVRRPRVLQRLGHALERPITILRAGAGYGKSVALNEALALFDGQLVRFSPNSQTDTLAAFTRGFADSLGAVAPAARLSFAAAWERALESASPLENLVRWLTEHLKDVEATIVLDQLHHVAHIGEIAGLLTRLAEAREPKVRWVLGLREELDLPIPRWLAEGKLDVPLDAGDLRFDAEDIVAAATQLFDRRLSREQVEDIAKQTEGWPAGVAFALRSLSKGHANGATWGAESFAALAARIFEDRTERQREFLLTTCLLPQLDEDLCIAAGFPDASELIAAMGSDRAFVFAESAGIRQYHDRFAHYLQERLLQSGRAHYGAALSIAVSALEDCARAPEALRLAAKHQLFQELTRLLDRHGLALMRAGENDAVARALSALPTPDASWSAVSLGLKAIFELRADRADTSDAWFALASERLADVTQNAELAYLYGSELLQRRRADAVAVLAKHAGTPNLPKKLQALLLSALASAYMQIGNAVEANRSLQRAMAIAENVNDKSLLAVMNVRAAYVALYSGDSGEAKERALVASRLAEETAQYAMACAAYSTLYAIAADDDDPAVCLNYLAALSDNASKGGNPRMQLYALMTSYELEMERGNSDAVSHIQRSLAFFDVHYESSDTAETILPSQALGLALSGRFAEAYRLLASTGGRQAEPDRAALRWAELALFASAAGRVKDARAALVRVRSALRGQRQHSIRSFRAQVLALVALALLGKLRIAASLADALAAYHPSARSAAMLTAAREVVGTLCGERNEDRLEEKISELASREAGGIGRLFLSIPVSNRARSDSACAQALDRERAQFEDILFSYALEPDEHTLEVELATRRLASRLCELLEDRNVDRFGVWAESFLASNAQSGRIRTVISFAPRALRQFLDGESVADARPYSGMLLELDEAITAATLSDIRKRAEQPSILDEVDAALDEMIGRLDSTDPLTAEHSRAVSSWCARLARKLNLSADEVVFASRSGLIHDIGKVSTPSEILNAPRKLSQAEWEIMRDHAASGAVIVRSIPILAHLEPAVRSHHERIDGKGYPDGIPGSRIPFIARLVAVADCFNAMIGRRPYRKPMPPSIALEEIGRHSGTQFDPEIVEAMVGVVTGL